MNYQENEKDSKLFLKYNYTETKDFCKQFLTLVVAVLVFSLTFSEKVIGFPNATLPAKLCLAISWILMLIAIVSCGIGLTYMAMAGGDAVYARVRYHILAQKAYRLIIVAGASFIAGLLLLIVAAVIAIILPMSIGKKSVSNNMLPQTRYVITPTTTLSPPFPSR